MLFNEVQYKLLSAPFYQMFSHSLCSFECTAVYDIIDIDKTLFNNMYFSSVMAVLDVKMVPSKL